MASQVPANALVDDSDWIVVEKRLRLRKSRIYALWFFLALITFSSSAIFVYDYSKTSVILSDNKEKNNPSIIKANPTDAQLPDVARAVPSTEFNESNEQSISLTADNDRTEVGTILPKTSNPTLHTTDTERVKENQLGQNRSLFADLRLTSLSGLPLYIDSKNFTMQLEQLDLVPLKAIRLTYPAEGLNDASHWEVGVSFTPSLSGNSVSVNTETADYLNRSYMEKVASSESVGFSSSIGFNIQYHFAKKWFISTGLFTTQRSEAINYDYIIDDFPVGVNSEPIITYRDIVDPLDYIQVNHQGSNSYHFIEIPLNLGYKQKVSSKFELRTQAGISYMLLINQLGKKADTRYLELKELTDFSFNTRNIGLNARVGLYYHTKRLTFGAEPIISRQLNNLSDGVNNPLIVKPYSYGFNITTNLKLMK